MFDQPTATTEYVAVDTETNGLSGDRCELTEIGAVLVGGGELHEEWDSLVSVATPLGRGIQRFTGISQEMVDGAPPLEEVLPRLAKMLRGRVLVAHNARFDVRVLRQAFARAALQWPDPPVICTVQMARRFAPLQQKRGLARLGRRAGGGGRRGPPRAAGRADVRAGLLRAVRAPVRERADHRRRARAARRAEGAHAAAVGAEPATRRAPPPGRAAARARASTSSATPTASRCTSASPWTCGCGPGRTSPPAPSWTQQAEHVDHTVTESELGALLLEDRLIKALKPPGQRARQGRPRRLRLHPLPAGHPVPDPGGGARAGRRPRRLRRPRARPRRRGRAGRAAELAVRPAPLRAVDAPPRASLGLRPDGPVPVAVPERPGPERLPRAAGRRAAAVRRPQRRRGAARARGRADRGGERPRSGTSARRGWRGAASGWSRCWRGSAACCARSTRARGWCWRRTRRRGGRFDAIWVAGGRVVDWGAVDGSLAGRRAPRARSPQAPPAGRLGRVDARGGGRRGAAGGLVDRGQLPAFAGAAALASARRRSTGSWPGTACNGSSREGERLASGVA